MIWGSGCLLFVLVYSTPVSPRRQFLGAATAIQLQPYLSDHFSAYTYTNTTRNDVDVISVHEDAGWVSRSGVYIRRRRVIDSNQVCCVVMCVCECE